MPLVRLPFVLLSLLLAAFAAHAQIVATLDRAAVPTGIFPASVAFNPSTHRVYVAGGDGANVVTVIDSATLSTTQVAVGRKPKFVAVNATTNRIYSSNADDGTVSVIDGATNAVASLPIGGAGPIAVNERTDKIYVMRQGNNGEVTVVDGATNNWYTISTGSYNPMSLVVNPDTNRLYVSHYSSGDVRAIDAASTSDHPPSASIQIAGHPGAIALNRATNKIYVTSEDSRARIVEIDGATNAATPIPTPGHTSAPTDVAVNPVTNRIYASFSDEVVVVDGATRAVSYIPTGWIGRLAVDAARDRVYAEAGPGAMFVIDGATNAFARLTVPNIPTAFAIDSQAHRVYAVGGAGTVVLDDTALATPPPNYGINLQGMWWAYPAGSESGWGFNIAHQGNTLFATLFTYDTDGSPIWFVMPNAQRRSDKVYVGDVYSTTGPAFNAATFDSAGVRSARVGNLTLSLFENDTNSGGLFGTINGNPFDKRITRQAYASPMPICTAGGSPGAQTNYQDMWWSAPAGGESGWGLSLAHEGDVVFAVLYQYDEGGKAFWLVASNLARTGNANYSGTLYHTWGPPYSAQYWNGAQFSVMPVGTLSLAFSDANNGVLTYSYAGITRTKAITREAFSSPATVCR